MNKYNKADDQFAKNKIAKAQKNENLNPQFTVTKPWSSSNRDLMKGSNKTLGSTQMLERSLDHYNQTKCPEQSFAQTEDPQYIKLDEISHNAMFQSFKNKISQLDTKNEFRLINSRGKIMDDIIQQVHRQIQAKRQITKHYQELLAEKYRNCHNLYEEAHKIKPIQLIKRNKVVREASEEKNTLMKQLETIKRQIKQLQSLYTVNEEAISVLLQNQLYFVINLLRHGYYRFDGIVWHLSFLIKNNQQLQQSYLPIIFDRETKLFVMKEYKVMKDKQSRNLELPNIKKDSVLNKIEKIKQGSSIRKIYQSAGEILVDWVNRKEWKTVKKIKITRNQQSNWEEKYQKQRKRIVKASSQQNGRHIQKVLFGIRQVKRSKTQLF